MQYATLLYCTPAPCCQTWRPCQMAIARLVGGLGVDVLGVTAGCGCIDRVLTVCLLGACHLFVAPDQAETELCHLARSGRWGRDPKRRAESKAGAGSSPVQGALLLFLA